MTYREPQRTVKVVQDEPAGQWVLECQRTALNRNDAMVSGLPLDMT